MTIKIEMIKYVNDILKIIFIYIHTSKKIHNAKKMLILMFLTLLILPLLILGYKSRKQCILIEKKKTQEIGKTRRYNYIIISI